MLLVKQFYDEGWSEWFAGFQGYKVTGFWVNLGQCPNTFVSYWTCFFTLSQKGFILCFTGKTLVVRQKIAFQTTVFNQVF